MAITITAGKTFSNGVQYDSSDFNTAFSGATVSLAAVNQAYVCALSSGDLIELTNSGTGDSVEINSSSTGACIDINKTGAGTGVCIDIDNDGTDHGIYIQQDGVLAASKYALYVYSTAHQTNTPLAYIYNNPVTPASQTQASLGLRNTGGGGCLTIDYDYQTDPAVFIDADGSHVSEHVIGLKIDADNAGAGNQYAIWQVHVDETKSYFAKFGATTNWTTARNPALDAPQGWIQIEVNNSAGLIPYYAKT